MVETVVLSLVWKLGVLALQEANYLSEVEPEVDSLGGLLEMMKASQKDADPIVNKTAEAKEWVGQLTELVFKMEDVIDMFVHKVERYRREDVVWKVIKLPKHLFDVHQLRRKIEGIKGEHRELFKTRTNLPSKPSEKSQTSTQTSQPDTSSYQGRSRIFTYLNIHQPQIHRPQNFQHINVVGFQNEAEEVAKLLMKKEPHESQRVVSITGMGGLGKSTLAKKIFNREDVHRHFDCQAFVTISKKYSIRDVLYNIISQVMVLTFREKKKWAAKKQNFLQEKLSDFLKEKTYLLVLDDVWEKEDWDDLKRILLVRRHGQQCRVLLTTRNEGVARHADPNVEPYKLQPLEKEESLKLFWKVYFRSEDDSDVEGHLNGLDVHIKEKAKDIVNKCGGLPLAIVVLGGYLPSRRIKSFAEWEKLHKSVSWHLNSNDNIRGIFSLSYSDLPFQYKLCLLYFGLFPDDTEIERDKLIRLWVTEGFLEQRGNLSMEDAAGECLEELMQRNLIQVAKWKSNEVPESYIIHDVLLSIVISEAKEGKILNISTTQDALKCYRRVALHSGHSEQDPIPHNPSSLNILRSLLCFTEMSLPSLCGQFKLLTVLDLKVTPETESLPGEIRNLILLKYLSLCGTGLKTLPPWVGDLFNLQTLDVRKTSIESLPIEILKLKKLRHLLSNDGIPKWRSDDSIVKSVIEICGYRPTIGHLGDLRDLRTLWLRTGNWIEDGLQTLNKLKDLRISGNVGDGLMEKFGEALSEALVRLLSLEVLHLQDYGYGGILPSFADHNCLYDLDIIGCLNKLPDLDNFPHSLTKLRLACGHLKEDMMVTLEKLPNLKNLTLDWHQYDGVVMKCSAGGFPKLEILTLIYFDWLRYWIVEEGAMPNLRLLEMDRLFGLKGIPDGLRHIKKLQTLKLGMPEGFLERVSEGGEDWEKIKHVPSIIIRKEEIPKINLKGFDKMEQTWFRLTGQSIPEINSEGPDEMEQMFELEQLWFVITGRVTLEINLGGFDEMEQMWSESTGQSIPDDD